MQMEAEGLRSTGRRRRRRSEAGVSVVEVLVAFLVIAIALLGTASTVISADTLQKKLALQESADRAACDTVEKVRNGDPTAQLAYYLQHATAVSGGESVTVAFPSTELTKLLPRLDPKTTCFDLVNAAGQVTLNSSKATAFGLLPVQVTVGNGANQVVIQALVLKP